MEENVLQSEVVSEQNDKTIMGNEVPENVTSINVSQKNDELANSQLVEDINVKVKNASESSAGNIVSQSNCGCSTMNEISKDNFSYVYVIGNIRPIFPNKSIQHEFNQIAGRSKTSVPDNQLIYEVLSQGNNLYLAREMCWALQVDGVDVYIVKPRTYVELNEIISSLQPMPGDVKFSVVVGPRGPIAEPEYCNGLQLPILVSTQFYHFTFNEFINAVVQTTKVDKDIATSLFQDMLQFSDNAGETDEHRAINYITLRYTGIYLMAQQMLNHQTQPIGSYTLNGISVTPSRIQGTRKIVDVIFNYEERDTMEKVQWYCRVDVTGQFPFLVSKLNRYYPAP